MKSLGRLDSIKTARQRLGFLLKEYHLMDEEQSIKNGSKFRNLIYGFSILLQYLQEENNNEIMTEIESLKERITKNESQFV